MEKLSGRPDLNRGAGKAARGSSRPGIAFIRGACGGVSGGPAGSWQDLGVFQLDDEEDDLDAASDIALKGDRLAFGIGQRLVFRIGEINVRQLVCGRVHVDPDVILAGDVGLDFVDRALPLDALAGDRFLVFVPLDAGEALLVLANGEVAQAGDGFWGGFGLAGGRGQQERQADEDEYAGSGQDQARVPLPGGFTFCHGHGHTFRQSHGFGGERRRVDYPIDC